MPTPHYEYSKGVILKIIETLLSVEFPFGLTVRYAVKANPHPEIIKLLAEKGIMFDTSSSYEATDLLTLGIAGRAISLSSQQSPHNLPELLQAGVDFVVTSLHQLETYINTPNRRDTIAVRINPPVGYGHNNRTSTGGINSSFGIWHEYLDQVLSITKTAGIKINRIHIHFGSGADPSVWEEVAEVALAIMERVSEATVLDIGGGFKVHRFGEEKEANMPAILTMFKQKLNEFAKKTGRQLRLEIEPGTYMIAHAGILITTIDDIVDTGSEGYTFLRLNTGMNDFLRSSLYGARHKIEVITNMTTTKDYVVVGHNCESGDILTPASDNPEEIETRNLKEAKIGDEVRIYDMGAYCASMRAKGYNSFPSAPEYFVD
ncbi:diaminopimelate decarboxylase [Candidatus Kaiserbacteria bacterium CG_4_8_14_3_um_filter_38_9]|uniref:Diaminopimelate decarboxylase n=1 Tax=Candidatus Kaiserbacteria bacterium CG_4_8_14_3_um_filter_38_9 TaxID=1974599 RepID=A0A2M7INJ9_9BACT|nr:MAG: diaminopimelate decarboxylase [Candidatus Kaiserbacteria bacterium CG_4_8_14_3_um_filter_38_9]